MIPQRVQLRRTRGWRKPPDTVVVARPSKWGNPFRVARGEDLIPLDNGESPGGEWHLMCSDSWTHQDYVVEAWPTEAEAIAAAVRRFRYWATEAPGHYDNILRHVEVLRGKNLACWCPLDGECHADVLLEIANG